MAIPIIKGIIPRGEIGAFLQGGVKRPIVQLDKDEDGALSNKRMLLVEEITPLEIQIVKDLGVTLLNTINPLTNRVGVGLAYNQIGGKRRVMIVNLNKPEFEEFLPNENDRGLLPVFNPQIIRAGSQSGVYPEMCLSLMGLEGLPIRRPEQLILGYQDREGAFHEIDVSHPFLARVFGHELDHLEGINILERLEDEKKDELLLKALAKAEELQKQGVIMPKMANLSTILSSGRLSVAGLGDILKDVQTAAQAANAA